MEERDGGWCQEVGHTGKLGTCVQSGARMPFRSILDILPAQYTITPHHVLSFPKQRV